MQPADAEVIFSFNSPLTPGDLLKFARFPINPQMIIPTPAESPLTRKWSSPPPDRFPRNPQVMRDSYIAH